LQTAKLGLITCGKVIEQIRVIKRGARHRRSGR
jgi:hypothetical protein